jgi:hypothetical protein
MKEEIYIVVGETEDVGQDQIGGPFVSHFTRELVYAFNNHKEALEYVESQKLAKPKKGGTYEGDAFYKKGYYNLWVETVEVFS